MITYLALLSLRVALQANAEQKDKLYLAKLEFKKSISPGEAIILVTSTLETLNIGEPFPMSARRSIENCVSKVDWIPYEWNTPRLQTDIRIADSHRTHRGPGSRDLIPAMYLVLAALDFHRGRLQYVSPWGFFFCPDDDAILAKGSRGMSNQGGGFLSSNWPWNLSQGKLHLGEIGLSPTVGGSGAPTYRWYFGAWEHADRKPPHA